MVCDIKTARDKVKLFTVPVRLALRRAGVSTTSKQRKITSESKQVIFKGQLKTPPQYYDDNIVYTNRKH